jgi:hypothetical protein
MPKPFSGNRSRSIALGVMVFAFFLGCVSEASARCGASPRQMLWRNAMNSELIRMDASELTATASPKLPAILEQDLAMVHADGDRPCSTCRCKNQKEPGIPIETAHSDSSPLPICRFPGSPISSHAPFLGVTISSVCDTFLCPSLGLLDRPPRVPCA